MVFSIIFLAEETASSISFLMVVLLSDRLERKSFPGTSQTPRISSGVLKTITSGSGCVSGCTTGSCSGTCSGSGCEGTSSISEEEGACSVSSGCGSFTRSITTAAAVVASVITAIMIPRTRPRAFRLFIRYDICTSPTAKPSLLSPVTTGRPRRFFLFPPGFLPTSQARTGTRIGTGQIRRNWSIPVRKAPAGPGSADR